MADRKDLGIVPVATAPSPASSGTSLAVLLTDLKPDGTNAILPEEYPFYATVVPENTRPTRTNAEIIQVTGASDDATHRTYTIVREQGTPATTAIAIAIGDEIIAGLTAQDMAAFPDVNTSLVHGEVPTGTVNGSNTSFTLSATPATGSLNLFQNGVRLKITEDYTLSTNTITMNTAPATGDILLADYYTTADVVAQGSTSFVYDETPSGTVNGTNDSFTIANTPVSGTLQLFRDGQLLVGGGADYSLSGTTITMTSAPVTGSVLKAYYQKSLTVAGNADTIDGFHANSTPTAGNIPVLDSAMAMVGSSLARQAIINGNFIVNQRSYISGVTLSAGSYGHDRWKAGAGGGDYSFTQGASSTQITIASGKTLIQIIEDKNVIGGTYTLSWEGTAQARVGVDSSTPSGTYASSPIAITGQTAGTVMSIEFNAGTLGKVQLNSGDAVLPFQPKSFEEELRTCMRYYEKSYDYGTAPGSMTDVGITIYDKVTADINNSTLFRVRKRVGPNTITIYSPTTGISGKVRDNTGSVDVSIGGTTAFEQGFLVFGGATANHQYKYQWTASAEL